MEIPSISVVIPVFNSEAFLGMLMDRLHLELTKLGVPFEVVLVNDGSRDRSWQVIGELAHKYPGVRGIDLMRNYGQHNALLCGIRVVNYDVVVTMDDDLQNPPEEIPKLLEKLAEGYDLVYGTPQKENHGFWREVASKLTKFALKKAMGTEMARNASSFRAFRTVIREAFANYQSPFVSIDFLLTWGTTRISAIKVRHEPRQSGISNYTFGRLVTHALNMMTGFSTLPLQLASMIGFIFTAFGLGVLVYVIGRYILEGTSVPGFPFLASIISIFSGAQLLALGIIGEYLARMHFRTMDRPYCVVKEELGGSSLSQEIRT